MDILSTLKFTVVGVVGSVMWLKYMKFMMFDGQAVDTPKNHDEVTVSPGSVSLDGATADETNADQPKVRAMSKQRRLEYLKNGIDSDCEIHVLSPCSDQELCNGKDVCYKKFRCHRIFLATASEKLEQDIFNNKNFDNVLQIDGVSPEAVEIFLEFIYIFEITTPYIELKYIGDIFILSCAYNLPEMLCAFASQLKEKEWPLDRIFPTFDLAFHHNIIELEHVCLDKILRHGTELSSEPNFMELQVYALNFVIQHWLSAGTLPSDQLLKLLRQYQQKNNINFHNTETFPHFVKIIKYFPNVLLDANGYIARY